MCLKHGSLTSLVALGLPVLSSGPCFSPTSYPSLTAPTISPSTPLISWAHTSRLRSPSLHWPQRLRRLVPLPLAPVRPRPPDKPRPPGNLPAAPRTAHASHPCSGLPVTVYGFAGGTIPEPAGPRLDQLLTVHEQGARRASQHVAVALLFAQVAMTVPPSPRAKDGVQR